MEKEVVEKAQMDRDFLICKTCFDVTHISMEKLLKYQGNSRWVIISLILMTSEVA